eukprot:COSAG06_NODE_5890_length_3225_cov_1.327261_4_plen_26_part_01
MVWRTRCIYTSDYLSHHSAEAEPVVI